MLTLYRQRTISVLETRQSQKITVSQQWTEKKNIDYFNVFITCFLVRRWSRKLMCTFVIAEFPRCTALDLN